MIKQYFIKYKYQIKYEPQWIKNSMFVNTRDIEHWWENEFRVDFYEIELEYISYLGEVNE